MEEPLDFRQLISDRSILLNGRRLVVNLLFQMTYICVELAVGLCVQGQEAGSNWLSRHKDMLLVLPDGTSHAKQTATTRRVAGLKFSDLYHLCREQ